MILHRKNVEQLLSILYPRRCPVCHGIVMPKGLLICPDCRKKLSYVKQPACKKCGKELREESLEYCLDCMRKRPQYEWGVALLNYDKAARDSISAFKYKNRREYADFYAEEILKKYGRRLHSAHADALVPVPVHPARRRQRGYNQAEELAKRLAAPLGLPVRTDLLIRTRKTLPQKQLNDKERLHNLSQAFCAVKSGKPVKTVILVDDIYTTGSTIEACTAALKGIGIEKVYFISIAVGKGY